MAITDRRLVFGRIRRYGWFKRFKRCRMSVDDGPRSGRPSTTIGDVHVPKVNEIVRPLMEKLGMNRAKFVLRSTTQDQKNNHVIISVRKK